MDDGPFRAFETTGGIDDRIEVGAADRPELVAFPEWPAILKGPCLLVITRYQESG